MRDTIKSLGEKLTNHDDSLFGINSTMSNLKLTLDDTHNSLENTRNEQDHLQERIERLENDQVLMKDDYETNLS
jgi:septation ring formation regulator EzrA